VVGPSITRVAHLPKLTSEPTEKAINCQARDILMFLTTHDIYSIYSMMTVSLSTQPELLDLRIFTLVGLLYSEQLLLFELQLLVHTLALIKAARTLDGNKVMSRERKRSSNNFSNRNQSTETSSPMNKC